jgi:enediyne biosynthesis protein E4
MNLEVTKRNNKTLSLPIGRTCLLLFLPLVITFSQALSSQVPAESVHFTNITESSKIRFQARNSATPNKYLIETMIGGVGVLDYDADGWLDIFFVNGAKLKDPQLDGESLDKSPPEYWNRLFRNNHDLTFSDVTEKAGVRGKGYGNGVAVGDFNNDGFPDFLVTNYGPCLLYKNNGDGTFSEISAEANLKTEGWATSALFLDYNKDGLLDIFVCRYLEWDFAGNPYCGHRTPGGRAYCHPDNFKAISNYLFKNNGNGTFTDVSGPSGIKAKLGYGLGVCAADFNNDSWPDIYVANDAFPQFLFMNNGDGTFTESGTLAGVGYTDQGNTFSGMGTDASDVDDDGNFDIVTTALSNETYAYFHNSGDGSFSFATMMSNLGELTRLFGGWGMHLFDYDNDGSKDLYLANSHVMDNIETTQPHLKYMQRPLLLRNDGKRFVDISSASGDIFTKEWASRGAGFGDLDNDGDVDIVVSNLTTPAYILRNDGGNRNTWIGLDLRGTKSNRDAIGARIRLTSESGKRQYYQVTTESSYQSANDRRVFIGIGSEKRIKEIRINWPSGIEQVIADPTPRLILKIEEKVSTGG